MFVLDGWAKRYVFGLSVAIAAGRLGCRFEKTLLGITALALRDEREFERMHLCCNFALHQRLIVMSPVLNNFERPHVSVRGRLVTIA